MNLLQKAALAVRAALSGPPKAIAPRPRREAADPQQELAWRRKELGEARQRLTEELAQFEAFADAAVKAGDDAAARERLRQAAQTREALASNARMTESLGQAEQDVKAQMAVVGRAAAAPKAPAEDDKSLKARMDRLRGPG